MNPEIYMFAIILLGGWLKVCLKIYHQEKETKNFNEAFKKYYNEGAFTLSAFYSIAVGILLLAGNGLLPIEFPETVGEALLVGISTDVLFHTFLSGVLANKFTK